MYCYGTFYSGNEWGHYLMENESSDLLSVDEMCAILKIGKNTAYQLLKSGKIKCFKIGRIWKISKDSIDKYILACSK